MAGRLNGKVALISGAGKGLGAAEARLFAKQGAHVLAADIDEETLAKTVAEIAGDRAAGAGEVVGHRLDVARFDQWEATVALAQERFGHLDILVNNAGVLSWNGIEDTTREEWDQVVAINQTGTWFGMKAALPLLRASGRGAVVNTSSILGIIGSGAAAAYQATKGAVRLLSKTAAVEYARQGVRVNSLHPGVIATPMIQDLLDEQGDSQPDVARTPMRRAGTPEEVAWGVVFLASDEASFVTGTELVIDGGLTAY